MSTIHAAQNKLAVTMGTDQVVPLVFEAPLCFLAAYLAVKPAHFTVCNCYCVTENSITLFFTRNKRLCVQF